MSETFTELVASVKTSSTSTWFMAAASALLLLLLLLLFWEFSKRMSAETRLKRIRDERYKLCVLLIAKQMRAQKRIATATTLSDAERTEVEKRIRREARDFCRYKPPDIYVPLALQDWEEHSYDLVREGSR